LASIPLIVYNNTIVKKAVKKKGDWEKQPHQNFVFQASKVYFFKRGVWWDEL
jgi:hypothetical protein